MTEQHQAPCMYAIRERGTDNYLPQRQGRRGYSHDEPIPLTKCSCGPRLVRTKISAQRVVAAWRVGKWYMHRSMDFDEELTVTPQASRVVAKLEIVQFSLTETKAWCI